MKFDNRTAAVMAALEALEPPNLRASSSRDAILAQLRILERPFDETVPTHLTASAVVVSTAGVLLHKHKRLGIWTGPGGHIDGDEAPDVAVLREVVEETGIEARHPNSGPLLFTCDVHPSAKGHIHLDLGFYLLAAPDTPRPPEGESQEVEWLDFDEAIERSDFVYAAALRAARALTPS